MIDMGNDLIIRPTHAFVRLRRHSGGIVTLNTFRSAAKQLPTTSPSPPLDWRANRCWRAGAC